MRRRTENILVGNESSVPGSKIYNGYILYIRCGSVGGDDGAAYRKMRLFFPPLDASTRPSKYDTINGNFHSPPRRHHHHHHHHKLTHPLYFPFRLRGDNNNTRPEKNAVKEEIFSKPIYNLT